MANESVARTPAERWRVGRKLGRTLYYGDILHGLLDSPEIARRIAGALNGLEAKDAEIARLRAALESLRPLMTNTARLAIIDAALSDAPMSDPTLAELDALAKDLREEWARPQLSRGALVSWRYVGMMLRAIEMLKTSRRDARVEAADALCRGAHDSDDPIVQWLRARAAEGIKEDR